MYTQHITWRPKVDGLSFLSIDADESTWLERNFEEQEVLEVIRRRGRMVSQWLFLENIMAVFMEFHSQQKFDKSYNATFVSLIPKKVGAVDVRHFQPISLVGGVYKILSQVLANRLKSVLGKISSNSHNAFIGGRQISDLVLITRKCAIGRVFGKMRLLREWLSLCGRQL